MICPKCAHTMNDGLAYCECCGSPLSAPQPKMRIVSTSTYRFDLYGQPEGEPVAPAVTHGGTAFYNVYKAAPQPVMTGGVADPSGSTIQLQRTPVPVPSTTARKQRRPRKMRMLFTVSTLSMLLLGFSSGMTAFANDDADSRMPLVVEYEETVAPDVGLAVDGDGADTVTILDDPVPMASSPTHQDISADFIVDVEPAPESTAVPAPIASTLEQSPAEVTVEPLGPCTLDVNGTRVPYIHSVFAPACPDNNAALWAGNDDTTDGSYGYFIGHNPGDFACVYSLVPGNYVTLCDVNGNLRGYTVAQLYDVPNTIFFHEVVDRLIPQGESLIMQTCIGDGSYYRIVVCQ